jgi:hypothetical protein
LFANSGWTSAANALNPAGHWTTADAGRVPWRATYVQESHPAGHTLLQYTTTTHWVDFRNVGGRPWRHQDDIFAARGRVFLAQVTDTGSPEENSVFYLSTDWVNQWQPGLADVSAINPDGIGRWTFKLYGRNQGSFTEDFNLVANGLRFFDYASIGHFYIPITVTHCC